MENDNTTITLKKKTKERLEKFGEYKETHDDIVNKLLDKLEN